MFFSISYASFTRFKRVKKRGHFFKRIAFAIIGSDIKWDFSLKMNICENIY